MIPVMIFVLFKKLSKILYLVIFRGVNKDSVGGGVNFFNFFFPPPPLEKYHDDHHIIGFSWV